LSVPTFESAVVLISISGPNYSGFAELINIALGEHDPPCFAMIATIPSAASFSKSIFVEARRQCDVATTSMLADAELQTSRLPLQLDSDTGLDYRWRIHG
jgi:hypothetical protein